MPDRVWHFINAIYSEEFRWVLQIRRRLVSWSLSLHGYLTWLCHGKDFCPDEGVVKSIIVRGSSKSKIQEGLNPGESREARSCVEVGAYDWVGDRHVKLR